MRKAKYLPSAQCYWLFKLCHIPIEVKSSLLQGWKVGVGGVAQACWHGLHWLLLWRRGCEGASSSLKLLEGQSLHVGVGSVQGWPPSPSSGLTWAGFSPVPRFPCKLPFSASSFCGHLFTKLATMFEHQHFSSQHQLLQVLKRLARPWAPEQNPQIDLVLSRWLPAVGPVFCWAF